MKQVFIVLGMFFISLGCTEGQQKTETLNTNNKEKENTTPQHTGKTAASNQWERLVMIPFKDDKGRVIVSMPFPSSWTFQQKGQPGEPHITGPKGIKVVDYPFQSFIYSQDPQLQQIYSQNGQQMRPMPNSIDAFIQQDFIPWGNQNGLQFVRHYEIPEIAKIDNWYDDQLFKVSQPQKKITAIGTEWKKKNGDPFFLLIRLNATQTGGTLLWGYFCSSLESQKDYYELAKKQLIFGIANAYYNPEPIMEYNRIEMQKVNQSWAAFNKRMAENQAAFQAQQRDFVNRSNAVNDAIMSNWKEQSNANEIAHERFVDAITERTNTVNTSTGTQQKVESGYNQYWMNSDGKYISTNSHTYDPNLDENLNNQTWDKLQEIKR